jgi:hypothetical protein
MGVGSNFRISCFSNFCQNCQSDLQIDIFSPFNLLKKKTFNLLIKVEKDLTF